MAGTTTIPLVTLPVGSRDFGPAPIAAGDSSAVLAIDRTVAGGLDATPATIVSLQLSRTQDGGVTWENLAASQIRGGPAAVHGTPLTTSTVRVVFTPGPGWQARATVTVSGAPVAVAGTLTTA